MTEHRAEQKKVFWNILDDYLGANYELLATHDLEWEPKNESWRLTLRQFAPDRTFQFMVSPEEVQDSIAAQGVSPQLIKNFEAEFGKTKRAQ
jgi:thymidylate kinase